MCPHEEKLTAWLLGDLPAGEQQGMACHIKACAACQHVLDELSPVLTPLRSGLEKDHRLQIAPRRTCVPEPRVPYRLWPAGYGWLRRAALFAVAFGTLFALISTVYRETSRDRHSDGQVTHITFQREEPPPPTLAPMTKALPAAKSALAEFKTDAVHPAPPAPIVVPPGMPEREPNVPKLRRLVVSPRKETEAEAAPPAVAGAAAPAHSQSGAKRQRDKAVPPAITRPPANLQIKPISLAAHPSPVASSVPTNAVSSNAPPAQVPPHTPSP